QEGRKDCAIIITLLNELPSNFNIELMPRFIILTLKVNIIKDLDHATVLVIDRQKKEYAYLDSLGKKVPAILLDKFKEQNVIEVDYTQADTSKIRTRQRSDDLWSCGFHAVENTIAY